MDYGCSFATTCECWWNRVGAPIEVDKGRSIALSLFKRGTPHANIIQAESCPDWENQEQTDQYCQFYLFHF